jgi:four helix bundle protein
MSFNLEYRERTKKFALRVIRLYKFLPKNEAARTLGKQLLRSGTSVGANFRAACRARSKAEYISKLNIALEEADESSFWMELLTIHNSQFTRSKLFYDRIYTTAR